ncbi:MAG: cytochrome c oxidase assembly protein [Phenylobacterium sp.]|nr:MAG: cytochrome c oxidase assembly protein [Phenylobacterium sp.]
MEAYCGSPPSPGALTERWNLDPILIAALVLALAAYGLASRSWRRGEQTPTMAQSACVCMGWAIGALALTSPLCALSVSLSAARVAQHMVLAAVAAPLLALGLPRRRRLRPLEPLAAAAAFAVVLWFWHAPGPYDATFASPLTYWAMHLSAFGAAVWLWSTLLAAGARRLGEALAAALLTSLQMGLLGAILTFANRPLYAPHALTTAAWGLTPLGDQQLAGAIMWIPAGLVLAAAVVGGLAVALRDAGRRADSLAPVELAR